METEKQTKQVRAVYRTLCNVLDKHEWNYSKDEEELSIECEAQGEDLPMDLLIAIRSDQMVVFLFSPLPLLVPEEKRVEFAVAVCDANNGMIDGRFDYNINDGRLFFRMTSSFRESLIGEVLFQYMIICACRTIDAYNDKFFELAKGLISLDQFIKITNE